MPEVETLGILEEIGHWSPSFRPSSSDELSRGPLIATVTDTADSKQLMDRRSLLDHVSYKWLSRNFLVSSNTAKKLLHDFFEKNGDGLEVMYSVAGWLKKDPASYHIRLVPGPKLEEAKQEFDGNCSVQIYSVQVCIPKDPATIWNAEFIQAEELFKQPSTVDNCLRDNRFCGIFNSSVTRNVEGSSLSDSATPQAKSSGLPGRSTNISGSLQQPQQIFLQESSPKVAPHSSNTDLAETGTIKAGTSGQKNEALEKDKASVGAAKKKGESEKSSAGTGGSLAKFWDRASTKSKSNNSTEEVNHPPKTIDSADAQVCAREALEDASSEDDEPDVNFKRSSYTDKGGKKRRVVLDDSDEDDYENAVNLGSPDPPKGKSFLGSKPNNKSIDTDKKTLDFNEKKECKTTKVKEEKTADLVKEDPSAGKTPSVPAPKELIHERTDGVDTSNKNKGPNSVPGSPKRRKVLKTRIDERGREDVKVMNAPKNNTTVNLKIPNDQKVKFEDNAAPPPPQVVNRAATTTTKKSGSSAPSQAAGKAGNKKGGNAKDPKQGNILSFFKRV